MNHDYSAVLTGLRTGDQTMPWPQRRRLVGDLADAFAEGHASPAGLELIYVLARDEKWEVRSDVAEILSHLSEGDFAKLAAQLSEDPNDYVRKAANRALDRRRKGERHSHRLSDDIGRLRNQWESLERRCGKQAATYARQIVDRQFEHLVGATVHEMRNALTPLKAGISSMAQKLDMPAVNVADLRRTADKAAKRIDFLERMLNDMRSFSEPLPMGRRRERLHLVVQEAVTLARESLQGGGRDPAPVSVRIDIPEGIVVEMARRYIVGALSNLVKNAIEAYASGSATFRPGAVRVAARVLDADKVEMSVEDSGIGIAAEDLEELRQFLPGKTTKKNQGTGFGLPIARRSVLAHHGDLTITSQESLGTTVTIVLPLEHGQGEEA